MQTSLVGLKQGKHFTHRKLQVTVTHTLPLPYIHTHIQTQQEGKDIFVNLLLVNKLTIPFYTFGITLQPSLFRHFVTINMKHNKKLNMVTTMLMESLQMVNRSIVVKQQTKNRT